MSPEEFRASVEEQAPPIGLSAALPFCGGIQKGIGAVPTPLLMIMARRIKDTGFDKRRLNDRRKRTAKKSK
jgi:hypothetical protein